MLSRFLFLLSLHLTTVVVVIGNRCSYPVASRAVRMRVASTVRANLPRAREVPLVSMDYCSKCGIYTIRTANPCRNITCPLS